MNSEDESRKSALMFMRMTPCRKTINGIKIYVHKNVFPSFVEGGVFSEIIMKKSYGDVLEIGVGSGINAISAARKARKVVATDINPYAIKCTQENLMANNIEDKVELRKGSLFKPVKSWEKFDIIIFNAPYSPYKGGTWMERSIMDYKHRTKKTFFSQVRNYLKPGGKIYMSFSDLADIYVFERIIKENKFTFKKIAKASNKKWNFFVYEITDFCK